MHEDILELQEQLEEAGLFTDGQSEETFENEFKKNGLKIPGKKVFKILKKSLKKKKDRLKDKLSKKDRKNTEGAEETPEREAEAEP